MKKSIAVTLSLLLLCVQGNAQDVESGMGLIVYRDLSGKLTQQSKVNARSMTRIALENGYVTLSIMLNYPFNVYFDQMTETELAAQKEGVRSGFAEVLDPLVAREVVWHPESGPFIMGPNCTVRATAVGLRSLISDKRILQIVSMEL